ncbi:hypothetical protein WMF30_10120 [Sorangium sp. So ce134]
MRRAAFRQRKAAAAQGAPAPAKKPRKPTKSFDAAAALAFVDARLAEPPPPEKKLKGGRVRPAVERVEGVGSLVLRCVLPLDDAPTTNRLVELGRVGPWALKKLKERVLKRMLDQVGARAAAPLPGRPMVRIVRFSGRVKDYDTGFTKIPLDRLQVGRRKRPEHFTKEAWAAIERQMGPAELGYLRGDSNGEIDLAAWVETAPPGNGCVLVEVWTGRQG